MSGDKRNLQHWDVSSEEKEERWKRLREAYERSGLTYDELANLLCIRRDTLASWLTKRRCPSVSAVSDVEARVKKYIKTDRGD